MVWFKVDDKLHDHRKARAAGVAAMGLWTLAGSWSADNLMDGFVPASVACRWDRNVDRLAAKLVDVGLWITCERDGEPGWCFHDWLDSQPSSSQVQAKRAAAAERQRKARDKARESRRDKTVSHAEVEARVTVPPTRPDLLTPNPTGHVGQHSNCRACGTNPRANGTNPRGPTIDPDRRPPIPDAVAVIAAALPLPEDVCPMPNALKRQARLS